MVVQLQNVGGSYNVVLASCLLCNVVCCTEISIILSEMPHYWQRGWKTFMSSNNQQTFVKQTQKLWLYERKREVENTVIWFLLRASDLFLRGSELFFPKLYLQLCPIHCEPLWLIDRSSKTVPIYYSAGKNALACLYFFRLITIILSDAKPRMEHWCLCKKKCQGNLFWWYFFQIGRWALGIKYIPEK